MNQPNTWNDYQELPNVTFLESNLGSLLFAKGTRRPNNNTSPHFRLLDGLFIGWTQNAYMAKTTNSYVFFFRETYHYELLLQSNYESYLSHLLTHYYSKEVSATNIDAFNQLMLHHLDISLTNALRKNPAINKLVFDHKTGLIDLILNEL